MGNLIMSEKERQFKALLEMVRLKKLNLGQVAEQTGYSYRQVKRRYKRYKAEGDAGLVHAARGRSSNNKHSHRALIIELYKQKYEGFGPVLASEKLFEDDGYNVNDETLRQWLLQDGLWCKVRKRSPYRKRRERKAQFGELIQIDGSMHDWFENGNNKLCLFNMVDDATGINMTHLDTGETTRGIFTLLWRWISKYGIPLAVYVDLKTVYIAPKELSYFQRVCKKLGIRVIKARSPQAKGRVERRHAVYQDRFVKELRLKNIRTIDVANELLADKFDDAINKKIAVAACNPASAHRALDEMDLNQIICWEFKRQVQNDWTFAFAGKHYQIDKKHSALVKAKTNICVRRHLDGTLSAWHEDTKLSIEQIAQRPIKVVEKKVNLEAKTRSECGRLGKLNSPWSVNNPYWLSRHKRKPLHNGATSTGEGIASRQESKSEVSCSLV